MRFNKVRILGVILIMSSVFTLYLYENNEYNFLLGIFSAIGTALIVFGRFNILKREDSQQGR